MKIFLDCCNYFGDNINLGDLAVYKTVERRLRAIAPDALVRFVTFDPQLIERTCPSFVPFVLQERKLADNPELFSAIRDSDLVLAVGGGCLSDQFAHHAIHVLEVLNAAAEMGKRTALLSCGFEPIEDPALLSVSSRVLPALDWISCREGNYGPRLLRSLGLSDARFAITGDTALEIARGAAPGELGNSIGIGLRAASYADVDGPRLERLRIPLNAAFRTLGATPRALPISLTGPADLEAIRSCVDGFVTYDGTNYDTPEAAIEEVGRCRVVVAGTYHAAVFALAQGVPCVSVAASKHYLAKLGGLNALVPESGVVLDLRAPDFELQLSTAVLGLWEAAPLLREKLLDGADGLIDASRRAFERFFDLPCRIHEHVSSQSNAGGL